MVNVNEPTCGFDMGKFRAFCDGHAIVFPQALVDYLMQHNDGELESNVIHFPDNEYYIRYFYGTTDKNYSDIALNYEWYADRLPPKCIPIADPDFGNQICMSVAPESYGKIYFWDHETMDTEDDEPCVLRLEDMILLADSLEALFEKILDSPVEPNESSKKVSWRSRLLSLWRK